MIKIRTFQFLLFGVFALTTGISYFSGVPDDAGITHYKVVVPSLIFIGFILSLAVKTAASDSDDDIPSGQAPN